MIMKLIHELNCEHLFLGFEIKKGHIQIVHEGVLIFPK